MSSRFAAAALALAASGWSSWAAACPSCATREGPGLSILALVGLMIAVPYGVVAVAIRVIRRLERDGTR